MSPKWVTLQGGRGVHLPAPCADDIAPCQSEFCMSVTSTDVANTGVGGGQKEGRFATASGLH